MKLGLAIMFCCDIIRMHKKLCRSSTTVSTYACHAYDDGSIPFCGSKRKSLTHYGVFHREFRKTKFYIGMHLIRASQKRAGT